MLSVWRLNQNAAAVSWYWCVASRSVVVLRSVWHQRGNGNTTARTSKWLTRLGCKSPGCAHTMLPPTQWHTHGQRWNALAELARCSLGAHSTVGHMHRGPVVACKHQVRNVLKPAQGIYGIRHDACQHHTQATRQGQQQQQQQLHTYSTPSRGRGRSPTTVLLECQPIEYIYNLRQSPNRPWT